jgi:hypothetical protein
MVFIRPGCIQRLVFRCHEPLAEALVGGEERLDACGYWRCAERVPARSLPYLFTEGQEEWRSPKSHLPNRVRKYSSSLHQGVHILLTPE